jgi:hypothetical protein
VGSKGKSIGISSTHFLRLANWHKTKTQNWHSNTSNTERRFMSNTQHTPGPWTANRRYVETDEATVCEVFGGNRADARLIAAAPELLAALQSLIDMDVAYQRGPKVEDAVEVARTVIAKATGGEV